MRVRLIVRRAALIAFCELEAVCFGLLGVLLVDRPEAGIVAAMCFGLAVLLAVLPIVDVFES